VSSSKKKLTLRPTAPHRPSTARRYALEEEEEEAEVVVVEREAEEAEEAEEGEAVGGVEARSGARERVNSERVCNERRDT
jgi:hypothetical protein